MGTRLVRETQTGNLKVLEVVPGGAAEAAGLQPDDHILAINGETVDLGSDLEAMTLFEGVLAGDRVVLTVERGGATSLDIEVLARAMPRELEQRLAEERPAFVEKVGQQEALRWLDQRVAQGGFLLLAERQASGELLLEIEGDSEGVPPALVSALEGTPVAARFDELVNAGDRFQILVDLNDEGQTAFEVLEVSIREPPASAP